MYVPHWSCCTMIGDCATRTGFDRIPAALCSAPQLTLLPPKQFCVGGGHLGEHQSLCGAVGSASVALHAICSSTCMHACNCTVCLLNTYACVSFTEHVTKQKELYLFPSPACLSCRCVTSVGMAAAGCNLVDRATSSNPPANEVCGRTVLCLRDVLMAN